MRRPTAVATRPAGGVAQWCLTKSVAAPEQSRFLRRCAGITSLISYARVSTAEQNPAHHSDVT
jgi:hypothetical protein